MRDGGLGGNGGSGSNRDGTREFAMEATIAEDVQPFAIIIIIIILFRSAGFGG